MRAADLAIRPLLPDDHGTVTVESTVLLALVAVGAITAIVALGARLLDLHRHQQMLLTLPFP